MVSPFTLTDIHEPGRVTTVTNRKVKPDRIPALPLSSPRGRGDHPSEVGAEQGPDAPMPTVSGLARTPWAMRSAPTSWHKPPHALLRHAVDKADVVRARRMGERRGGDDEQGAEEERRVPANVTTAGIVAESEKSFIGASPYIDKHHQAPAAVRLYIVVRGVVTDMTVDQPLAGL